MRERLLMIDIRFVFGGITPACAGTTCSGACVFGDFKDHPRLCGNDFMKIGQQLDEGGSPPLVRERRKLVVINL